MKNFSRNTTAVLVLTLFTGLAIFSVIQLGDRLFGTPAASAQALTSQAAQSQGGGGTGQGYADPYGQSGQTYADPSGQGQTYTCPATGCTASTCHATQ